MTSTSTTTLPAPRPSSEHERVIAVLLTAFAADPVIRWVYPASDRYLTHFPALVSALSAEAFRNGTIDGIDGRDAVALWVPFEPPPGSPTSIAEGDDGDGDGADGLAELLQRTVDQERWDDAFAFLAQVEQHHPIEPHWYLPFIGVDPVDQGHGLGSRLLEQGIARCDADRLPAYLEASSERNRRLYERHGFQVMGEIQAGDSPPLWPMLRRSR